MLSVVVHFHITSGEAENFREAILEQSRNSLGKEPGCRQFDVCVNPEDENHFVLYEVYEDAAAFAAHRETDHYAAFTERVTPLVASKDVLTVDRL
ncbi:MAG: putative quinol monooxygenase [Methyloligellaceae bacterium]